MKKCVICGKEFVPRNQCQKTCSGECSIENKRRKDKIRKQGTAQKPAILTCPNCGKEFRQNVTTQIYCSDKCRNEYNKKRYLDEYHAKAKGKSETKICAQCGQEFITTNGSQKYCSAVCCEEYWGRNVKTRKLTCKNCGEKFTDVYAAKYCSKKCRNEAIKKEQAKQAMAKATSEKVKTIEDWTREACECNMDYGTYRGLIEQCGRTYEELKATADSRAAKYHAHAGKSSKNACDSGYGRKVG